MIYFRSKKEKDKNGTGKKRSLQEKRAIGKWKKRKSALNKAEISQACFLAIEWKAFLRLNIWTFVSFQDIKQWGTCIFNQLKTTRQPDLSCHKSTGPTLKPLGCKIWALHGTNIFISDAKIAFHTNVWGLTYRERLEKYSSSQPYFLQHLL